jgi:hypothetical protein
MKIEVKGLAKHGYESAIYKDGKMIPGIREALISIRPDREALLFLDVANLDESGHIIADKDGDEYKVKSHYEIYAPGEFVMEA